MRRLVILVPSIALAVTVGLSGAAARATPNRASDPSIVCPASPGIIPCCGPIVEPSDVVSTPCCPENPAATTAVQPICCGAVAPCSVTISASPDPADGKQQVTVSGTVVGGAPAGAAVDLWQEVAGANKFSQVGSTTVGSELTYSITAPGTVDTNRQWYVTSGALQSATISEHVSAVVTLRLVRGRHSSRLHGSVTPSHAGEKVLLERKVQGKWVTIARLRLNKKSRFGIRFAGTPRVKATFRAVLSGDDRNIRSSSKSVTGVALPRVTAT